MDQYPPFRRRACSRAPVELVGFCVAALVLSVGQAATGEDLATSLDCPRTVLTGQSVQLDLRLENESCSVQNVRILSTIVGNGNDPTIHVGIVILGPEVAASSVAVPAATDLLPGTCVSSRCTGSFLFCVSAADCVCRRVTPGTRDLLVSVPTPIPAAFDGTVVNQFVFTDPMDGTAVVSDSCLISVPEAGIGDKGIVALAIVLMLIRFRGDRAGYIEEEL